MKLTSIRKLVALATIGAAVSASAQTAVTLNNATLWQDPQTRVVEVTYELTGPAPVLITLGIETNGIPIPAPVTLIGDVTTTQNPAAVEPDNAPKKIYWNAKQDWPGNLTDDARATVTAWFTNDPPESVFGYVVVDLSAGPSAPSYPVRYSGTPPDLGDDTCRTTELWLRRIPAGVFQMGSPSGELGGASNEDLHIVTLTKHFYIGVFPVTQRQYQLVRNVTPSGNQGDMRPVESLTYNAIRGAGSDWPANNQVDSNTFMGNLRARTGLTFDLPTEAQWEYACRAGTMTSLNSGKNITVASGTCLNMAEVGRYYSNNGYNTAFWDGKGGYEKTSEVGAYLPNAWGLYDMHGNVREWCLDRYVANLGTAPVTDPVGGTTETVFVQRGGSWGRQPSQCRSASRDSGARTQTANSLGFRACIQP